MQAIENVLINGTKTADIGGQAKTYEVGDAIASCVAQTKMDVFAME